MKENLNQYTDWPLQFKLLSFKSVSKTLTFVSNRLKIKFDATNSFNVDLFQSHIS